jgi:hypothetical protein
MSASRPVTDVLEARHQALRRLDGVVRGALISAAHAWRLPGELSIVRTDYPCIYSRTPQLGGHWTLFSALLTESVHAIATVNVALEFEGDRPVDLWVSGARDVVAGGCTTQALNEALAQCDGPLRQVTPIAFGATSIVPANLSALVLDDGCPTIGLN